MDEADHAQIGIDAEAAYRLAQRKPERPNRSPRETCFNCERPLPEALRENGFCDKECLDEFEYMIARQKANR